MSRSTPDLSSLVVRAGASEIVIVDDDDQMAETIADILKDEGHRPIIFGDGSEALSALTGGLPAKLILLDLMMMGMSGWEFRIAQRKDPRIADIPTIVMSADPRPEAAAIDADAFITKPARAERLLEVVRGILIAAERERARTARLVGAERLVALGTMAAGIAHEINNPLAYVLANLAYSSERLLKSMDDPAMEGDARKRRDTELVAVLAECTDGARRIEAIVRDIRMFSRSDVNAPLQPVDVHAVLERALMLVSPELGGRATVRRNHARPLFVTADEGRLAQVFLNLLTNALQAIEPGRIERNEVRIETGISGGEAFVAVSDSGCGMPPNVRKQMFEPFFTTKAPGTGTGLGMAISASIIRQFNGRIEVDSEVGRGSTVRIFLPAAEEARPPPSERRESAPPPVGTDEVRARMLVVEDDLAMGRALVRLLARDYDTTVVTNGSEALAELDRAPVDVILCDLLMPVMNGPDLREAIARRHPELVKRMVFMTGGAVGAPLQEFLKRTDVAHITKPFDLAALRRLVASGLSR